MSKADQQLLEIKKKNEEEIIEKLNALKQKIQRNLRNGRKAGAQLV